MKLLKTIFTTIITLAFAASVAFAVGESEPTDYSNGAIGETANQTPPVDATASKICDECHKLSTNKCHTCPTNKKASDRMLEFMRPGGRGADTSPESDSQRQAK